MKKQFNILAIFALFVSVLFISACGGSGKAADENTKDSVSSEKTEKSSESTENSKKDIDINANVNFNTDFVMKNKFVRYSSEKNYELTFTSDHIYNLSYREVGSEGDYDLMGTYEIDGNKLTLRPSKCFRNEQEIAMDGYILGFAEFAFVNSKVTINADGFGNYTHYSKHLKLTHSDNNLITGLLLGIKAYEIKKK